MTTICSESLNYLGSIPLITPAVKKDSCEINHLLITSRISTVINTSVLALGIGLVTRSYILLNIALLGLTSVPSLTFMENWLANRVADVRAAQEYINCLYPSKAATAQINNRSRAAQKLADLKGDFNKVNEAGKRLFDYSHTLPEFKIFKIFIDAKAKLNGKDVEKLVAKTDSKFLQYALDKKVINPSQFSSDEQVRFWSKIQNNKSAVLLKNAGFKPNIQNSEGYTALQHVIRSPLLSRYTDKVSPVQLISTLLQVGADPKIMCKADNRHKNKNCMELTSNPAILAILKKHLEKH